MRIISGVAGGIKLSVPTGEVRPTTDRVREALFSILGGLVVDARVLDLFAGSGAVALECLSRGARMARAVDLSRSACLTMKQNAAKSKLPHLQIVQGDALSVVRRESANHVAAGGYDIIFADPPYCKSGGDVDYILALAKAGVAQLLAPGGVFIAEVQEGWGVGQDGAAQLAGLVLTDSRHYGKNLLLFYTLPQS